MAWSSANLTYAANLSPSGQQFLGHEPEAYGGHPFSDSLEPPITGGLLSQNGYNQPSISNLNAARPSPHIVPYRNQGLFHGFSAMTQQRDLKYHEDLSPPDDQCLDSRLYASMPSVEGLSLPKARQTLHSQKSTDHRVKKVTCRPNLLECGWKDCKRPRPFTNKGTLMRHVKTQHIDPHSNKCPNYECDRTFCRKENMEEHLYRVHKNIL